MKLLKPETLAHAVLLIIIAMLFVILILQITTQNKSTSKNKNKSYSTEYIQDDTRLNINTANAEDFIKLGFPRRTAEWIIEYRFEQGDFEELEDLLNVKGIGEHILDKYSNQLKVE